MQKWEVVSHGDFPAAQEDTFRVCVVESRVLFQVPGPEEDPARSSRWCGGKLVIKITHCCAQKEAAGLETQMTAFMGSHVSGVFPLVYDDVIAVFSSPCHEKHMFPHSLHRIESGPLLMVIFCPKFYIFINGTVKLT